MIIVSTIVITLWLLFYSYYVSNQLSDHIKFKDVLITTLIGSVFPFVYVLNLILSIVSNVQLIYYVQVVTPKLEEDCE